MLLKYFMEKVSAKKGWWDTSDTLRLIQTKNQRNFQKICMKYSKNL